MITTRLDVMIRCDWVKPSHGQKGEPRCDRRFPVAHAGTKGHALERARANGWGEFYGLDYCPEHRAAWLADQEPA